MFPIGKGSIALNVCLGAHHEFEPTGKLTLVFKWRRIEEQT